MRVNTSNSPVQANESSSLKKSEQASKAGVAKKSENAEKAAGSAAASEAVKSSISERGKEFSKAKEVAANTPDVREEKIAELKKRIAAGKYKVDTEAVADRLVNDHLKSGIG